MLVMLATGLAVFAAAWFFIISDGAYAKSDIYLGESTHYVGAALAGVLVPALGAWPGSWIAAQWARARTLRFRMRKDGFRIGKERFRVDDIVGKQVVRMANSTVLLLTPRSAASSLIVEIPRPLDSSLDVNDAFGTIRFAVRTRPNHIFMRALPTVVCAALYISSGHWWGLGDWWGHVFVLRAYHACVVIVPLLLLLTVIDLTGWCSLEIADHTLKIGKETLLDLHTINVSLDRGSLVLADAHREKVVKVWHHWGRSGDEVLWIIKATIGAAKSRAAEVVADGPPYRETSRERGGQRVGDVGQLSAVRHFVPSTRLEAGVICMIALVSFGVTFLAMGGTNGPGNAITTALLFSAYAIPVLAAWLGTWIVWALTARKGTTFSVHDGCVFLGDERIPIRQLAGFQIAPTEAGRFIFLQRPSDRQCIVLEISGAEAAQLPEASSFGFVAFAVRTGRRWVVPRLLVGAGYLCAMATIGAWAHLLMLFFGIFLVPVIWGLMLLDHVRTYLVVTRSDVKLDGVRLGAVHRVSATLGGNLLMLESPDAERLWFSHVRLRSYEQPAWATYIRFVKASLDAANRLASEGDGSPSDDGGVNA